MEYENWKAFRAAKRTEQGIREAWAMYGSLFAEQRVNLEMVYEHFHPQMIACLGAGSLAEIPVRSFLQGGSRVHCVEWIPELTKNAFNLLERQWIKDGFSAASRPSFLEADVTLGRASAFGDDCESLVEKADDPVTACRRGMQLVQQCGQCTDRIDLPDGSMDLVISSMVVSQFYANPFDFFMRALSKRFGEQMNVRGVEVFPLLKQMRRSLYETLVQGHVQELYRLVSDEGRVYFSMEFFLEEQRSGKYYFFEPGDFAIRLMSELFWFRFDVLSPERTVRCIELPDASAKSTSEIIHSYLLEPQFDSDD